LERGLKERLRPFGGGFATVWELGKLGGRRGSRNWGDYGGLD